ncbi:hypothetical protein HJG60_008154 [Phyllostomus discolor]|uniref:Uncharacterized protein n=1 Tax=Phyllostomus discolor TaxID=89673 RepID=A0A833Z8M7_9CHIR|nr:hypothetical protein HJG60_008154 [Phyllostomus discolor]
MQGRTGSGWRGSRTREALRCQWQLCGSSGVHTTLLGKVKPGKRERGFTARTRSSSETGIWAWTRREPGHAGDALSGSRSPSSEVPAAVLSPPAVSPPPPPTNRHLASLETQSWGQNLRSPVGVPREDILTDRSSRRSAVGKR